MKIELDDKKKKMIAGGALAFLVLILIVPSFFKSDAKAVEEPPKAPTHIPQSSIQTPQQKAEQQAKVEEVKVDEVKQDPVPKNNNNPNEVGNVIKLNNIEKPTNTISDLNVDNLIAQAGVDTVSPVVVQNAPSAILSDNVVKTIVVDQNGKVLEENAKNVEKTLSDPNTKVVAAINVGQKAAVVPSAVPVMQAVAVKPASEIEVIGAKKKVVGNDVYVTASGSYNGASNIQPIQIRDVDRTIYVDFKPEIVVSGNCCSGSCGKSATTSSSKSVNVSENKSTVISKTTRKKVKVSNIVNKSTKKSKRGASGVLVPKDKKIGKDESNIKIGEEDEYNRISCIGGCKSKLEDRRIMENKEQVGQTNGRRKCNKAGGCSGLRQDVYVINNIVNVDEDEIITDKMLDRMENVDRPIVKNVNQAYVENGRKVGYVGQLYADEHQNDVIRDDYNKFGEIAFVDGEYD